jgi:hypothetical protein
VGLQPDLELPQDGGLADPPLAVQQQAVLVQHAQDALEQRLAAEAHFGREHRRADDVRVVELRQHPAVLGSQLARGISSSFSARSPGSSCGRAAAQALARWRELEQARVPIATPSCSRPAQAARRRLVDGPPCLLISSITPIVWSLATIGAHSSVRVSVSPSLPFSLWCSGRAASLAM